MKNFFTHSIRAFLFRNFLVMLIASLIDAKWGDPQWIYDKLPHPIIWIGKWIGFLDRKLNQPHQTKFQQKRNGFVALALTVSIPALIGYFIQKLIIKFFPKPIAYLVTAILGSIFIARRSLYEHVQQVEEALIQKDIFLARKAVSQIVGRDTDQLDESGIARAAIESLAENFSDGVIAPIFWGCVGGLPTIIAYKAINTADSMIGHKNKKYQYFGYASAKTDDYVNYPASRLSALCILLTSSRHPVAEWKLIAKEAKKHNSPNAGWPEAAMATCLSIYLVGPRRYQNNVINTPWIGRGKKKLNITNIKKALDSFVSACNAFEFMLIIYILILKKSMFKYLYLY